mmetsp:Transcript_11391/g.21525  ORF Transcript_11391/g.21525 Transcript_11391/m.21525 type:complete len:125 (+) Transcript_11391:32-406(+)
MGWSPQHTSERLSFAFNRHVKLASSSIVKGRSRWLPAQRQEPQTSKFSSKFSSCARQLTGKSRSFTKNGHPTNDVIWTCWGRRIDHNEGVFQPQLQLLVTLVDKLRALFSLVPRRLLAFARSAE